MIKSDTLKVLRQALIMRNVIDERNLHLDYQLVYRSYLKLMREVRFQYFLSCFSFSFGVSSYLPV